MDYTSKLSVNKYVEGAWLIICKTMRSYFTALFSCKRCDEFTSAVGATRVNSKGLNSLYDYRYGIDLILIRINSDVHYLFAHEVQISMHT